MREVSNIESATEDIVESEGEQVQDSEGEESELDTNTMQDSNRRIHHVRRSMHWLNI
jgi:hypothetical protein